MPGIRGLVKPRPATIRIRAGASPGAATVPTKLLPDGAGPSVVCSRIADVAGAGYGRWTRARAGPARQL